jgi:hypothetical protein
MDGGRSSISTIGTVRVSAVKFHSTRLSTLSTSPDWEFSCYYWSPGRSDCGPWPRMMHVPCIIDRSHWSHICMQQTYIRQILWHIKKMMIYNKNDIKITYTTKKKLQRWRLTHLPSLLTRRYWYLWVS